MAEFNQAIKPVLSFEGVTLHSLGYVNDPDDNGGETVAGISRKFWKNWDGWKIIDNCITEPDFPINLTHNESLIAQINEFYKVHFWGRMSDINDQSIADLLLNVGVNQGTIPAIKRAQNILGLPENGKLDDNLINALNNL